jgi:hypothetical protein
MDDTKKQGQGLRLASEQRRAELEQVLAHLGTSGSPGTRKDIEAALQSLSGMLTGDLDNIPTMVGEQLGRWLDRSKYLGLKELREIAAKQAARPS